MADDVPITAGSGTAIATDEISSRHFQRMKIGIGADGTAVDWSDAAPAQVKGAFVTVSTDVTRPADTTTYAINEAIADSASSPTAGGFTFTGVARASGGSGIIVDAIITTSGDATIPLQGEVWIFDTAPTAINDNAAFAVSDAEIKTYVGKIPFIMEDAGNNGACHVTGINIGFTTVGSANLRFLMRTKNAYVPPANSEVITVRLKIEQIN